MIKDAAKPATCVPQLIIWQANSRRSRSSSPGFSFGSYVGLRLGCEDSRVKELVGAGIPVNDSDLSYLARCSKPKLILQSAHDQFGSRERTEALFATLPEPKKLVFVEAPDHFFAGKLPRMGAELEKWIKERDSAGARR